MSAQTEVKRITIPELRARKGGEPIVCLTAYTTQVARLLDPHVDLLLVGDSLGMVLYGFDSTIGVGLDMMINHGGAVRRGANKACIIVDMPFGTYEESPQQAFRNAARVMSETRCSGVKLEGGAEMAETIAFLTKRGVPVMAHVGLMPQSVHSIGGFKAQGRGDMEARRIIADAKAVADAGAFAVVVEGTMEQVAREVTEAIDIPTIGIGASAACDGQILVTEDLIGLFGDFKPRFVKRYADMSGLIDQAVGDYASEVRARTFPGPDNLFGMKKKS